MKKFKKQFLAASLILALGAAVYLNWSLSAAEKPVSKTLGESKLVNATVTTAESEPAAEASAASVPTDKQKAFFSEAKIKREKTQDKIIDEAKETLNLENASESEYSEAQSQVAGMLKNFTLQDTVEDNLKAKGFSEALCAITDSGCTVNVLKSELTDESSMVIKATVKSVTNIGFDKISIITV